MRIIVRVIGSNPTKPLGARDATNQNAAIPTLVAGKVPRRIALNDTSPHRNGERPDDARLRLATSWALEGFPSKYLARTQPPSPVCAESSRARPGRHAASGTNESEKHEWWCATVGRGGEGLTRTESLPALRVVGFDPSPTSSLKEERNKPSLSSAVSFSPVAVSARSPRCSETPVSRIAVARVAFSRPRVPTRTEGIRRGGRSRAMRWRAPFLAGVARRGNSFAPPDGLFRDGRAHRHSRTAGATPSTGGGTLYGIPRHRVGRFSFWPELARRAAHPRAFFARASLRLRARVQMLFDPRRRPPVGRRLRPSTPKRPPRPTPTRGATTTNHRSVSLTTNAIPTPISAPLFAPQTTAAATAGGVLTHPPRSRILATFGVDMYDYHNSLFFPPFARAAIARATLRRRGLRPTLASARSWAKHHHTFHSCLVPLEPITTTCKTALKHRERVIRTPRDGDDRTSVSARFAALFGGDTRARRRRRTARTRAFRDCVYQYHSDEMTPTDYAHRTLARSRLALARSNASHPFERSNKYGTDTSREDVAERATHLSRRALALDKAHEGRKRDARVPPERSLVEPRQRLEGVHRQRRASGELISSERGRLHLRLRTDSRLGRVEFEGEVQRRRPQARRELGVVQHGEHQRARRDSLSRAADAARASVSHAWASARTRTRTRRRWAGSFAPPRNPRPRCARAATPPAPRGAPPPPSPSTAGPAAPSRRPVRWRRWRGFPRVEAARGVPRPR